MADPIRRYQQARRRRDAATQHANQVVAGVRYAAILFERWHEVEIVHPDFEGPRDTSMPIETDDWPTIEAIVEALNEWHRAEAEMHAAWEAIPDEDRTGLQPPPVVG